MMEGLLPILMLIMILLPLVGAAVSSSRDQRKISDNLIKLLEVQKKISMRNAKILSRLDEMKSFSSDKTKNEDK